MAIRYAMNRRSIASATLPADIINAYYHRLSDLQKSQIAQDLKQEEETYARSGLKAFGDERIDRPNWLKFWYALDTARHVNVKTADETFRAFEVDGKFYCVEEYVREPHKGWYINPDMIESVE